ncbi:hypothetical protein NPIL_517591 [Nephila pilipes]|uniref:Uncharacterized protein n=1 Tax=Nephila pilipes TaxID=299642 RepID=A0A8X6U0X7_NEPPI|nr:hypothetical protein NPIL_517591 [Nephila pilipes]
MDILNLDILVVVISSVVQDGLYKLDHQEVVKRHVTRLDYCLSFVVVEKTVTEEAYLDVLELFIFPNITFSSLTIIIQLDGFPSTWSLDVMETLNVTLTKGGLDEMAQYLFTTRYSP